MKLLSVAVSLCCLTMMGSPLVSSAGPLEIPGVHLTGFGVLPAGIAEPIQADAPIVAQLRSAPIAVIQPFGEEAALERVATPVTAATLPLIGLFGLLTLCAALALGAARRRSVRVVISNGLLAMFVCLIPALLSAQSQRTPVNLGSAGNYVVLSETGITDVPPSVITGNIGASPITGAAIHLTCAEVIGTISAVDAAGPAPCTLVVPAALGTAVLDMQTAYADAAGRTVPDFTELGAGNISGRTLAPGLYKWSTGVSVDNTGVTLSGGPNAVWIFQIAGDVLLANNAHINLAGGASANNIFWQVGGPTAVTIGTGAVFSGNILSSKQVIMNTGATLNGRAYAFTQVTLQSTGVTNPGLLVGGIPVQLAPTVTSTVPANLSLGVPIGNALSATFSTAMDPATINPATFTLKNGLTTISGVVTYAGVTATFTPTVALPANTLLTATITTGAKDTSEVALLANYVWTFTTGSTPDITPPTVSSTIPANGATAVPIGNALSATFSEAMAAATINGTTFLLKQGVTAIPGTVNYAGVTATFMPTGALAASTLYNATITTGVTDLAGNALVANYVWTFTTGAAPDVTPPTVSSTVPANGAVNVAIGNALTAMFSEAMAPLTINTNTFLLKQGLNPVAGTVTYAGVTATFTPASTLAPNSLFTATITTGVTDLAGNALAVSYTWTFTTGATPDITPPTVVSTVPANSATGVAINSALAVTFSEAMAPLTINTNTFLLKQGITPIAGTVGYSGVIATLTPLTALAPNTLYTASITTGVTDLAGNALVATFVWSFTTAPVIQPPPPTPPMVISTTPLAGATLVTTTSFVTANFSAFMNPLSINTATFLLTRAGTAVPGTVTYSGTTATFRPTSSLLINSPYIAVITAGATDLNGTPLQSSYQWTFTTGSSLGQQQVCLANFAVLSGTAIFSTGSSAITGDIGVSPGASITGFPPGTITGTMHAGDAAAAQAMTDLSAGYLDAVARSVGPVSVTGDIGGQTFTPGLYKSITSLAISSGDLTLDANGNPNAVFIFQMAGALTTSDGRKIILAGGAQAFNVFWQVGTSATLGSSSTFQGSILAEQSITLNTGATVAGRLLARVGTVTLQSNVVISPPPVLAVAGTLNAASWTGNVAAGSIAAVFGNNLGSSLAVATGYPLLTTLGGGSIRVGTQNAPLFMTYCNQANLQIPWETVGQTQTPVTATVGGQVSVPQFATVVPYSPGIFAINMLGTGQGAVEIAPTALLATAAGPLGRPVQRGEYIVIFCTGLGPVSSQPATGAPALSNPLSFTSSTPGVTIGGAAAQVTYSGLAPGFAGLYQVNALVPAGAPSGSSVNLIMTIAGFTSNVVTIAVQ